MPIDDHLLRDERILATASGDEGAILYATNKRVVRYKKGRFRENVDSLYYSHIVSASYWSQSYTWLAIIGALLFVGGVFVASYQNIGFFGILFAIFGIALIVIGIIKRPKKYVLKVPSLSKDDQKLWRTKNAGEDAKTFARFIQDMIAVREVPSDYGPTFPPHPPPPTPPPEPIFQTEQEQKAVVYVRCRYCHSLMPEDARYCTNCGASL
jgi:hypothetical protein